MIWLTPTISGLRASTARYRNMHHMQVFFIQREQNAEADGAESENQMQLSLVWVLSVIAASL